VLLSSPILVFDVQADVLNYLVQESLAHAALVFATLAAAFTFAAGFKKTVSYRTGKSWIPGGTSLDHLMSMLKACSLLAGIPAISELREANSFIGVIGNRVQSVRRTCPSFE